MTGRDVRQEVGPVNYTARRIGRWASCLFVLPAIAIAGCGTPQFHYVSDSSASAYFKVPYFWHKIGDSSLAAQLKRSGFTTGSTIWETAYDAGWVPSASHVFSAAATKPVALALITPLSPAASNAMSYNMLRDIFLPVTPQDRQQASTHGFQLQGFRLLSDSVIAPGKNVHGVREIYQYTYPDGHIDTFDQVALTNSNSTMVYLLLVHCLSTCYSKNSSQIDTVMTSFTVRSP